MQYLLNEDEYRELQKRVPAENMAQARHAMSVAREAIMDAAGADCIHKRKGYGSRITSGYCSACPIKKLADRSVSEEGRVMHEVRRERYELLQQLCPLEKAFPK